MLPSGGPGPFTGRLTPDQYLGKKGRSLPGSHRPRGLLIAAGPSVAAQGQIELGIEDSAALVLARIGVALPPGARGRVPQVLHASGATPRPLPDAPALRPAVGDLAALEARLRALGYVD
jgi:hypothetical protein